METEKWPKAVDSSLLLDISKNSTNEAPRNPKLFRN